VVVLADIPQILQLLNTKALLLFHLVVSGLSRSHMNILCHRNMFAAVLSLSYITEVVLHSWHPLTRSKPSWLSRNSTIVRS
jgi:hypothetical protein